MSVRIVDRAFEVAHAAFRRAPNDGLAHPFGFDRHPPHVWRISPDVWEELHAYGKKEGWTWMPDHPTGRETLLGSPLIVDETLPPNSMLLEQR